MKHSRPISLLLMIGKMLNFAYSFQVQNISIKTGSYPKDRKKFESTSFTSKTTYARSSQNINDDYEVDSSSTTFSLYCNENPKTTSTLYTPNEAPQQLSSHPSQTSTSTGPGHEQLETQTHQILEVDDSIEDNMTLLEFDRDHLTDELTHDRDRLASLARLAVAFAPSNTAIDLKQIQNIEVVDVDGKHIEISAVVCDDLSCATVLVPITFPHACVSGMKDEFGHTMEECVLENIHTLDDEAQHVIEDRLRDTSIVESLIDSKPLETQTHQILEVDEDPILLDTEDGIDDDMTLLEFDRDHLTDELTHDRDRLASLARLAVAFAPSNTALDLKQIQNIEVVDVDGKHIEISAVVCDDLSCATVLVPITFPHACVSGMKDEFGHTMEECVLENIHTLDDEAQHVIEDRLRDTSIVESLIDPTYFLERFHSQDDIHFPSNWIHPTDSDMINECIRVKSLLNDEGFQKEVNGLARYTMDVNGFETMELNGYDPSHFQVCKSRLASIGPQGMILRVLATRNPDDFVTNEQAVILDVPYSFDQIAEDATSIRNSVLAAVSALS